jgi:tRNA dimethylallyltransferase
MSLPENSNKSVLYPVSVIVGPTAVGKTRIAIEIARELNAEIVSADSRQIYKLMNIGTAKPGKQERQGIRHHFMDYVSPGQNFSAGEYGKKARLLIAELRSANKNIVVVGGSGLYIRALLYGMISFDQKDEIIRRDLKKQLKETGLSVLYKELEKVDPELAGQLSPNDTQRILRGLEVYRMSGEKLSSLQRENETAAAFPYIQIGLTMERAQLYQRINKRVEQMFAQGLIEEVKTLLHKGFAETNAMNAVGYKEVVQYLKQQLNYQQMMELIKRNSRRYAKRQFTWFRKDESIHWFELPDEKIIEKIIQRVILPAQGHSAVRQL